MSLRKQWRYQRCERLRVLGEWTPWSDDEHGTIRAALDPHYATGKVQWREIPVTQNQITVEPYTEP